MALPNDFVIPPIFEQAQKRTQGNRLRENRALEAALANWQYKNRTVPGLINTAAAASDFYSGTTSQAVARAGEEFSLAEAVKDFGLAGDLADIEANQFLIGLGVRL